MAESAEKPEIVYHYTSMRVLLEILQNEQLWATNIHYLNDAQERMHFMRIVLAQLPTEIEGLDERQRSELKTRLTLRKRPDSVPFVVSFSEAADSLPQWQSYCHEGNGVALGFRTRSLERAFVPDPPSLKLGEESFEVPPAVRFKKVRYFGKDDQQTVVDLISSVLADARGLDSFAKNQANKVVFPFDAWLEQSLESTACMCKNKSFAHEMEWRLIVSPMHGTDEVVRYRASRFSLLPYIPLQVPQPTYPKMQPCPTNRFEQLPTHFLERVIIGPTPNIMQSHDALEALFHSRRRAVKVERSNIPFRDWL